VAAEVADKLVTGQIADCQTAD